MAERTCSLMSDRSIDFTWGGTVRRIANEFDERLGSPASEIVTFESAQRAIAVGIVLPGSYARLPVSLLLGAKTKRGPSRARREKAPAARVRRKTGAWRELARVHRVIVLGAVRCVNRVYLLHGVGNKLYAVHGVGAEEVQDELRADMDAIAARLSGTE